MGKVLGGSSRINFNIHLRGHISTDYLTWQNGYDWCREDVLYYFNKYEKSGTYNSKYNYIKKIYITVRITSNLFGNLSLCILILYKQ